MKRRIVVRFMTQIEAGGLGTGHGCDMPMPSLYWYYNTHIEMWRPLRLLSADCASPGMNPLR